MPVHFGIKVCLGQIDGGLDLSNFFQDGVSDSAAVIGGPSLGLHRFIVGSIVMLLQGLHRHHRGQHCYAFAGADCLVYNFMPDQFLSRLPFSVSPPKRFSMCRLPCNVPRSSSRWQTQQHMVEQSCSSACCWRYTLGLDFDPWWYPSVCPASAPAT